ncbi:MAG TPA: YfhO family protein [Candidatus Eisenbacteria bacterium]|nr:YfhO family protein [Candidatus Eisenbacteria bacterium]
MFKKYIYLFPILLFIFVTCVVFYPYFTTGKVPFAGNLLVSFYQPWKSYPLPEYPNGPANKPIGFDSLRIFYPLRHLTIDSLKQLQLPMWNPYDFAGNTHLATYQSAVFFPLTLLFLLLPFIDAWSLVVIVGPLLACIFTYYFLRSLKLSVLASVIGAVTFGFSGTLLVLTEESFMAVYSILFLPLILLGIQRFFQEKRIIWFGCIVGGCTLSILSGWFQSSLYALLLSFLWAVFLLFQTKKIKTFLWVIVGFGISFLLSAPHILPNLESFKYSARGTTDAKFLFDTYLIAPWHLITYIVPDFLGNPATYNYFGKGFYYEQVLFVGVVGLFFGLVALLHWRKSPVSLFFTLAWIITLSLGMSLPTSRFLLYNLHLPIISTILPSRIFILSSFSLAVLAGFGWDLFRENKAKISLFFSSLILILSLTAGWIFVIFQKKANPLGEFSIITYHNLFIPTVFVIGVILLAALVFIKNVSVKKIQSIGYIVLLVVSIFLFATKYIYFSERRFVYPSTPVISELSKRIGVNRFWSIGQGYIDRNFATNYSLQSPEGYDSFYIKRYGEFVEATKNKGTYTPNVIRADAQFVTVGKLSEIQRNIYLTKALNLLGVKYIAARNLDEDEAFIALDTQKQFQKVWTDGIYSLYENTTAFPRAFLVDNYIISSDPQKTFSYLFSDSTNMRKQVVVVRNPKISPSSIPIEGKAKITTYSPEKVVVDVTTNKDTLLFLSDNDYPGWKAMVDNKPTILIRTDYTFRSVAVPKGKHTVVFVYQPESVALGFVLCGIGSLLFLFIGFTITKRSKNI